MLGSGYGSSLVLDQGVLPDRDPLPRAQAMHQALELECEASERGMVSEPLPPALMPAEYLVCGRGVSSR